MLGALLPRVRVGVEEIQVADDDANSLEDEGLQHMSTFTSSYDPDAGRGGAVAPLLTISRPAMGRPDR